ncbi:DNA translocase FtsK [bacterium]|nr:DNA translocase FtsK [bacterium]
MLFFGRKKKKTCVVTKRTPDDVPFVIPYISYSEVEDNDPAKARFASPMHGTNNKDELVMKGVTRADTSKYDAFRANPINKDDEYKEFVKVPSKKPIYPNETVEEKPSEDNKPQEDVKIEPEKKENIDVQPNNLYGKDEIDETPPSNTSTSTRVILEPIEDDEEMDEDSDDTPTLFTYDEEDTKDADPTLTNDIFNTPYEKETNKKTPEYDNVFEEDDETPFENTKDEFESFADNTHENIQENDEEEFDENAMAGDSGYTFQELAIINSGHKSPSFKGYKLPPLSILNEPKNDEEIDSSWINGNIDKINETLKGFRIDGQVVEYTQGPTFTRYAIMLGLGVSGSRVSSIQTDLQRALESTSIRIENPIPGKAYIGIEVPNKKRKTVLIKELLNRKEFLDSKDDPLKVPVGLDVEGNCKYISINKLPHALVAGASGSGKSVFLNAVITSLLFKNTPEELRFFFIDPKQVDLQAYSKIPHLLAPVVSNVKDGIASLKWLNQEMERRFSVFRTVGCSNIFFYKKLCSENKHIRNMPFIVAVIDECGDFLMGGGNEAVTLLTKLIQLCRAAGIYIFLSTQKPVAKIFPTSVKSNAPGRFAFKVTSQTDSFVILDEGGAESLLGNGDMIFQFNSLSSRYQAAYIDDMEIKTITKYVSSQCDQDFFFTIEDLERKNNDRGGHQIDDLFYDIARFVVDEQKCSNNQICKRFGVGFNRGSDIIEALEYYNIVGKGERTKPREILVSREELEIILDRIKHAR